MANDRDIFHSEAAPGATVIDATGPGALYIVDLKTEAGSYHFEIPGALPFRPSSEIRVAPKIDNENLKALVMRIYVRRR